MLNGCSIITCCLLQTEDLPGPQLYVLTRRLQNWFPFLHKREIQYQKGYNFKSRTPQLHSGHSVRQYDCRTVYLYEMTATHMATDRKHYVCLWPELSTAGVGLAGTQSTVRLQSLPWAGHLALPQAAHSPTQPGLGHSQGWGIRSLSGQPGQPHSHLRQVFFLIFDLKLLCSSFQPLPPAHHLIGTQLVPCDNNP